MPIIIGFFTGSSIGYFTGLIFGGSQVGQPGLLGPLVFDLGSWQIHLHHWLMSSAALIFLVVFLKKKYKLSSLFYSFSFGFLAALVLQGIFSYSDWHQVIIKQN
ncbi:MAG: hypothetical protein ABIG08_01070 [bacterium]